MSKIIAFFSGVACALSVRRWLNDAGRAEVQQTMPRFDVYDTKKYTLTKRYKDEDDH